MKEEWQYQYDVLGRRTSKVWLENGKILADSQIEFIWDGSHLVQEIHKSDGKNSTENNRTFSYIYSHPNSYEPLAQLEFAKDNEKPTACYYYHNDQIGVPRELTDEEGKVCWYGRYTGWGKLKESYQANDTVHQPFRLQNQYCDQETGLHYNFFRYYEPNIGRFTQLDPIGLAGGENLYRFESTVQNAIDPLGLAIPLLGRAGFALIGVIGAQQSMQQNDDVYSSSKVLSKNENLIPRPQCPDDVYEELTKGVEQAKKETSRLGKCLPEMTKDQLDMRIDAANREYNARKLREDICWNGGDSGHRKQLEDIKNRIKKCASYY